MESIDDNKKDGLTKNSQRRWYVLRAIGGKEKKVKEYIENEVARLKIEDLIAQVLIPTEKVFQIRNGKRINKERNFYPGYVLIEAVLQGEVPHILKNIPNVIGFLGAEKGGSATPLRESEVKRILGQVDELSESESEISIPYFVGETVKVTDGPFSSMSGAIEEVDNEKRRLKVTIKIFNRKTPVFLDFVQVEKE